MLFRIILVLVWCGFASPTMAQVWPTPSTSILRRICYENRMVLSSGSMCRMER